MEEEVEERRGPSGWRDGGERGESTATLKGGGACTAPLGSHRVRRWSTGNGMMSQTVAVGSIFFYCKR